MVKPLHLFPIPDAQQHAVRQTGGERFPGDDEFRGANPPYGAIFTFSLNVDGLPHPDEEKERARKEKERSSAKPSTKDAGADGKGDETDKEKGPRATITVADTTGTVIRTFKAKVTQGLNRAAWNLRRDEFKAPSGEDRWWEGEDGSAGPEVPAGLYTVTVKYKDHTASASVRVLPDPRFEVSEADRAARWQALLRAGALQETVTEAIQRITDARTDVEAVVTRLKAADKAEKKGSTDDAIDPASPRKPLLDDAKALTDKLLAMEKKLRVPPKTKGIVDYDDVLEKVRTAQWSLGSSWKAPTPVQTEKLAIAEKRVAAAIAEVNSLFANDVAPFRQKVHAAGIALLEERPPLAVPAR